jgi:hypothetical protein
MSAFGTKLRKVEGGGLMFRCPGCDHPHLVRVGDGDGPRWEWNGSGDAPTFTPSILVNKHHNPGAPTCHSFVTDGRIKFLDDCTHHLAGQTVRIPDWVIQ